MTNEQKPREFLEYPMVIDWLQWSDEFKEDLRKPDMPQITLTLISEMKKKIKDLELQLEFTKQYLDPVSTSFRQMIDNFMDLSEEQKQNIINLTKASVRLKGIK